MRATGRQKKGQALRADRFRRSFLRRTGIGAVVLRRLYAGSYKGRVGACVQATRVV